MPTVQRDLAAKTKTTQFKLLGLLNYLRFACKVPHGVLRVVEGLLDDTGPLLITSEEAVVYFAALLGSHAVDAEILHGNKVLNAMKKEMGKNGGKAIAAHKKVGRK